MNLPGVRMDLSRSFNKRKEDAHSAKLSKVKQIMKKITLRGFLLERESNTALKLGHRAFTWKVLRYCANKHNVKIEAVKDQQQ